jgi:hypothetical protein
MQVFQLTFCIIMNEWVCELVTALWSKNLYQVVITYMHNSKVYFRVQTFVVQLSNS